LAHRWHLGCALDEELPDHSRLIGAVPHLSADLWARPNP
jgi:hypothetical protein